MIKQGCKNRSQNLTDSPANLKLIKIATPKNKYKKIKWKIKKHVFLNLNPETKREKGKIINQK